MDQEAIMSLAEALIVRVFKEVRPPPPSLSYDPHSMISQSRKPYSHDNDCKQKLKRCSSLPQ